MVQLVSQQHLQNFAVEYPFFIFAVKSSVRGENRLIQSLKRQYGIREKLICEVEKVKEDPACQWEVQVKIQLRFSGVHTCFYPYKVSGGLRAWTRKAKRYLLANLRCIMMCTQAVRVN